MKVYHGTSPKAWEQIEREGLKGGCFATDPAFALMWQGADSIVVEVEGSRKMSLKGMRGERGLVCTAFELNEGETIPPEELRRLTEDELVEHRKYLASLGR